LIFQDVSAVFSFSSSVFQKTHKSKFNFAFFNNSIVTIESFHPQIATKALLLTLKSFLQYFLSELFTKLNSNDGEILLVYKNSPNQFI
jgi:hypothetical protein